ncbi:threonine/serine exporter family protein [Proteinivorax hydrogeniformans]|uniref:Threonine/serine exporter family protein n=1 Tax=Proteinivorax hydrogeniformans TaxID=1826727 RepID=A0AAU8HW86_9FIRM
MDNKKAPKKAIVIALYAGEIMLKNGGETYRVEETMCYILRSLGVKHAESFVTPTGIFLSSDSPQDQNPYSIVKRIRNRKINLTAVSEVNSFSREMVAGKISMDEAMGRLKAIDRKAGYSRFLKAFAAGLLAASFTMLLGGSIKDFMPAFITSLAVQATVQPLGKNGFSFFLTNIAGGFVAAFMAVALAWLGMGNSIDKTIIGSIMTLVPGVAITNAIRDSISGDLMSGTARAAEALLIAVAIATGVGVGLQILTPIL